MGKPKVLLLSTDETESVALQHALGRDAALRILRDFRELQGELKGSDHDAVFCGWSFSGGTWRDVLQQIQQGWPDLPVIVLCRAGGEKEWLEVLQAGGFDLLVPPHDRQAVLTMLEHAIASHNSRISHGVGTL
jgi:DNA-binding NtrC family response regulator